MAKITDFIKQSGQFLKASDVVSAKVPEFIISSEGLLVNSDFKGKVSQRVHVEGVFSGNNYIFDMSKTNARIISEKLGDDTAKWIGHSIILETYKTKTTDGKLTDAINVKEVK